MDPTVTVGIDLGTTNSTAAWFDGVSVSLVRSRSGSTLTPSVVRIDARGNVTVGERARRFLDSDPENTRAEFKRLMGTDQQLAFAAARATKRPQELAAEVLRALREDLTTQLGFAPEQAVISVPALFELPQIAATGEAARLAGFTRIEVIQEPVASAIAAGWTADGPASTWLVYDLGGGTFDASLMETSEGLLRVVGHDGDNFLGGRDFDAAIVTWVLERLRAQGVKVDRADPAHATALRRLRWAAEEAKIDLSQRSSTGISLPALFTVDGEAVDVDEELDVPTLEALVAPLVDRSIAVCQRLLARHGLRPDDLDHVVLIGGPTAMPMLRERVKSGVSARFATSVDPMTAVAQGAALFAATAGLSARPPAAPATGAPTGPRVWLQHPAVTADEAPFLVGRVLDPAGVSAVRAARADGSWTSAAEALDAEHTFALALSLRPRQVNDFHLFAVGPEGKERPFSPPSLRVVHGLSVGDPPLARSVGVALANDGVQLFVERGAPLPMRRTFTLRTVAAAGPNSGDALRVPIVQGEFALAHLCRLVGTLVIEGSRLSAPLPAGSAVEITLELDRGGRLSAHGLIPSLNQTFAHVEQLVVPQLSLDAAEKALAELASRLGPLQISAFRDGDQVAVARLGLANARLAEALSDLGAARGGDADAGEKSRRTVVDVDAELAEIESARAWPDAVAKAETELAWSAGWVAGHGEPTERKLFSAYIERIRQFIQSRKPTELAREVENAKRFGRAAYLRDPGAVAWSIDWYASRVSECRDPAAAAQAARAGRAALERGDHDSARRALSTLVQLAPPDAEERRLGHDSGVR